MWKLPHGGCSILMLPYFLFVVQELRPAYFSVMDNINKSEIKADRNLCVSNTYKHGESLAGTTYALTIL